MIPWHALLAPLPTDATVARRSVAPGELRNDERMAAIAGLVQLTVELSAGNDGLRHLMVVLDAAGLPISAGDHVMTCRELPDTVTGPTTEYVHESIGGRLEADGSFNGTRWRMVRALTEDEEDVAMDDTDVAGFNSKRAIPTPDEIAKLKALVADILDRARL